MFNLGPWELIIILLIVVIVFGVGRLPELGTGLGQGLKNFKKGLSDAKEPETDSPGTQVSEKDS